MDEDDSAEVPVQPASIRTTPEPVGERNPPPEGLERIFLEHHRRVFRAAFRITGSAMDAEDVLQTVFLRLLRMERGERLSGNPARYLHLAAVNGALDLLRARAASARSPLPGEGEENLHDDRPGPERLQEGRELRARLREAIGRLSPMAARAVALRYPEGCDNSEIARMLGTSRAVIAVTLHRARSRLRREIGRHPQGDES